MAASAAVCDCGAVWQLGQWRWHGLTGRPVCPCSRSSRCLSASAPSPFAELLSRQSTLQPQCLLQPVQTARSVNWCVTDRKEQRLVSQSGRQSSAAADSLLIRSWRGTQTAQLGRDGGSARARLEELQHRWTKHGVDALSVKLSRNVNGQTESSTRQAATSCRCEGACSLWGRVTR